MNKRLIIILIASALLVVGLLIYISHNKPVTQVVQTKTCTTYNGYVEEQCIEDYIGLSKDAAISKAESHKYRPKIASIDGVGQANSQEAGYIIFFVIEKEVVTDAYFLDD